MFSIFFLCWEVDYTINTIHCLVIDNRLSSYLGACLLYDVLNTRTSNSVAIDIYRGNSEILCVLSLFIFMSLCVYICVGVIA